MEMEFECLELVPDEGCGKGNEYYVGGTIQFEVESGEIGMVPYGDTHVWHPGNGDSLDIESITFDNVTEYDPWTGQDQVINLDLVQDKKGELRELKKGHTLTSQIWCLVKLLHSMTEDHFQEDSACYDEAKRQWESAKEDAAIDRYESNQ